MRKQYYGFILLAGIAVLVAFLLLRDSETEKILLQLETIRALAEVHSPESTIEQASKAMQIGEAFSEQTRYDLTNLGHGIVAIDSRKELIQKILKSRASLSSIELAIDDPQVHINGNEAHVELLGTAIGSSHGAEGQFLDSHRVDVMFELGPDGWLMTGARHIRDERQPPEQSP